LNLSSSLFKAGSTSQRLALERLAVSYIGRWISKLIYFNQQFKGGEDYV